MRKRHSKQAPNGQTSKLIETLESRQLLSAITFAAGIVKVTGDASSSNSMSAEIGNSGKLSFQVNGQWDSYNSSDVKGIEFDGGSAADAVYLDIAIQQPATVHTGAGNDTLRGGGAKDYLDAGDGNDLVYSRGGNSTLLGGNGDDTLIGDKGDEYFDGGAGNDSIQGYSGNDTIIAGDGSDSVHGGDGNDLMEGDVGNDLLMGGAGNDTILGNDGNDTLTGHSGADKLDGGAGTNVFTDVTSSDMVVNGTTPPVTPPVIPPVTPPAPPPTTPPPSTGGDVGLGTATLSAAAPTTSNAPRAVMNVLGLGLMAGSAIHVNGLNSTLGGGEQINTRYEWNFGDTSGAYNTLEGFNAAHVYSKPGTYVLTLTVTAESGKYSTVSANIVVATDTRKTIYVDAVNGNDSNSGLSSTSPIKTITRADSLLEAGTELLFHRGQTWRLYDTFKIPCNNVLIGSYGTGEKPIFEGYMGSSAVIISLSQGIASNVVIQDLSLRTWGTGNTNPAATNMPTAVAARGMNVVVKNVEFYNVGTGISGASQPRYVLVQGCTSPNPAGLRNYLFWLEGSDHTIIGNTVANSTREHILRSSNNDTTRVLIAYNDFTNLDRSSVDSGDGSKTTINIRAGSNIYIAHNKLSIGVVGFGPTPDLPVGDVAKNIVMDGNWLHNSKLQLSPNTWNVAARNNIFDIEGTEQISLNPHYSGTEARYFQDIEILNNTGINNGTSGKFLKVYEAVKAGQVIVLNNLYAAPNLEPGGSYAAGIDVRSSNLDGFKTISNNVWPSPTNAWPSYGGINFLNNQYDTITQWNALSKVGTDWTIDIAPSSIWSTPLNSILKSGGTNAPGVFADYNGKDRPLTTLVIGAIT